MVLTVYVAAAATGGVAGGVLDMSVADRIRVPPWNSLCYLYPHQVNKLPRYHLSLSLV